MSGGVDSSLTAAMLLEQGYDVTGVTFRLFSPHENAPNHLADAKSVAKILGIKHLVFDFSDIFECEIISYFINEYMNGRTPNPCVVCNKKIKFGAALDRAVDLGFDYFATGHYARTVYDEKLKRFLIKKSLSKKDQTYCLYTLNQKQLSRIIFPLADFEKTKTREMAKRIGLPVHNKPDSQDICFISGNHADFIEKRMGEAGKGNFIDEKGEILGVHSGIYRYTIGQRRGLGISAEKRSYVSEINSENNSIKIGSVPERKTIIATNANFIPFDNLDSPIHVSARVRYSCNEIPSIITPLENKTVLVDFKHSVKFVAPGQSVVFYKENTLVGGGIIL
jgi:tRNA-specific 2-thiouridylase